MRKTDNILTFLYRLYRTSMLYVFPVGAFLPPCLLLLLVSCSDDSAVAPSADTAFTTYRVAVVMPLDTYGKRRYERTVQWFSDNLNAAQLGLDKGVRLEIDWYDENSHDMAALGKQLVADDGIVAVVGPYSSVDTYSLAHELSLRGKPLVTPSASSAQLIRGFSGFGFLWALAESDISQCEVLLAKAYNCGAKRVRLVAADDIYGETFSDWFAFQATEMGLTVDDVVSYGEGQCEEKLSEALQGNSDYVVFVPANQADVLTGARLRAATPGATPLLMSDMAYDMALPALGEMAEGVSGVCMYANPESGFEVSYRAKFDGDTPTVEEINLYDALMLIAFALREKEVKGGYDLNENLRSVVSTDGQHLVSWDCSGMRSELQAIAMGTHYNIYGASGPLDFDKKVYTNVLHSTYIDFVVHNGKFVIQGFASADGSRRTDAALAGWNWKASHTDSIANGGADVSYPALDSRWALLVAPSSGWTNYRQQADVLNMYQILKGRGYDDDHIVLIMEDDIACNAANTDKGNIRVLPDGDNLYHDVTIDYHPSALQPSDIRQILCGEQSDRLPQVIHPTANDNVFVFWSGHGEYGQLVWCDRSEGFTADLMGETAEALRAKGCYRKMGWFVETCFSASVMKRIEGIPGMMAITAADERETSKADVYNATLKVWMSNRFSSTLAEAVTANSAITVKDLYYRLVTNTIGSHPRLYNQAHFGNLNVTTMKEWL
ncbi:MAG: C13 family peptidase [Prevotella sp.]